MSEEQKKYEEQDKGLGQSETKKFCCNCCCSYLKGSVKAACKLFECIAGCA